MDISLKSFNFSGTLESYIFMLVSISIKKKKKKCLYSSYNGERRKKFSLSLERESFTIRILIFALEDEIKKRKTTPPSLTYHRKTKLLYRRGQVVSAFACRSPVGVSSNFSSFATSLAAEETFQSIYEMLSISYDLPFIYFRLRGFDPRFGRSYRLTSAGEQDFLCEL